MAVSIAKIPPQSQAENGLFCKIGDGRIRESCKLGNWQDSLAERATANVK